MKRIVLSVAFVLSLVGVSGKTQGDPPSPLLNQEATSQEISILFAGDVMLGGRMIKMIHEKGTSYPFEGTREYFQSADLFFCNLEAPFGRSGIPYPKRYNFLVPPEFVEVLVYGSVDGVSLANNHIMDYGIEGLRSTLAVLKEKGIAIAGAGRNEKEAREPGIFEVKGIRVAFLAYSNTFPEEFWASRDEGGTAFGKAESIRWDIRKAKKKVDIVIVSFHWGGELETEPKKYMKRLAHLAIREGADCVIGHHPHVIQGIEKYKKGIIAYSLGNFAFGSYSEKPTGIFLRVVFDKEGWKKAEVIPLEVNNFIVHMQPRVKTGRKAQKELDNVTFLCYKLGTEMKIEEGIGVIENRN
jgi:poly-gamma-glutamate synthesis protein (capsule biosynthesis protein)